MNDKQKSILVQFFNDEFEKNGSIFPLFASAFLIDFLLKTKQQQKASVVTWLDARKTRNTNMINSLAAQKDAAEIALNGENTEIEGLKSAI